jgi:HAE1 family hydrophobic/amphiphilic exporter-1
MQSLARFSLANRALIALVTIFVLAFGLLSTGALKQELIPSLQLPVAAVITTYVGASPAVVDEQISRPISDAVKGVTGLEKVTSTASSGTSVVTVQVKYGTDLDKVQSQLQTAINRIQGTFPEGVDSQVIAGSFDDFPVIQLAVSSDLSSEDLAPKLNDSAVTTLSRLDGVRDVTVSGARTQRVVVDLDAGKLASRGLTSSDVSNALRVNGVRQSGGAVQDGTDTLSIEIGAPFGTLQQIKDVPLLPATPGGGRPTVSTLSDVADVSVRSAPPTGYSRVDGKPALTLAVTKKPDGNTVAVSDDVRAASPDLSSRIGGNAVFTVAFDQAPFISQSISDLTTEGLLGLAMAIIVILVFLMSLRSTLVTAVSIPMSLMVTMIVLRGLGYSLNILTLGALTIAIGRVVDDSIVVIENIKRHLSYGEEKLTAILTAVREVAGAVTASTATTVAVFAPIAFVGGQVGELFRPFAVTVAVALVASLFVALTIIPVLAYWWLGLRRSQRALLAASPDSAAEVAQARERRSLLQRGYVPILRRAVAHPVITLVIAVVILGGTVALTPQLTTNFLGDSGQNTITVSQSMPDGTSLDTTDAAAKKVESAIAGVDGITTVQTTVGSSGDAGAAFLGGTGSNQATFAVTFDEKADATAVQNDVSTAVSALTGVGETTVSAAASGFGSSTIDVSLTAPDEASLTAATKQVHTAVADTPGTSETTDNLASDQPILQVQVDRTKAVAAGTTEAAIGAQVSALVSPARVATLTSGGQSTDVVLQLRGVPDSIGAIGDLAIPTPTGVRKLSALADVKRVDVPTTVTRENSERNSTVSTTPKGKDLGTVTSDLTKRIDALDLPAGVATTIGGVSQDQQDSFRQLFLALLAAIAIVYVVMVATFKSLIQPLLLLVSVPFAATGALIALLISDTPLGVPSLIGMLMLVGIVVTNAIVLIDLVNQRRRDGMSIEDAVFDGARLRLRPILMTAIATIFALIPMSLGLTGGGAFISQPLAVVVIGGLFSSTVLTLVLVPVLYTLIERARGWRGRREGGRRHGGQHAAA